MVNYSIDSLDGTFGALADSNRRAVLERLAYGAARVTDLAEPFGISLPAVSKHLRVLENAGLLVREKKGRVQKCRLAAGPLQRANAWLGRYQRHWDHEASHSETAKPRPPSPSRRAANDQPIFSLTKNATPIIFNRFVKFEAGALNATFSALADPTRRTILICLAFAESSVTELAAPFNISLPAFSKHLRVLQQAGLVDHQKHGRIKLFRLVASPMYAAATWIDRYRLFWEKQFDALAAYLEKQKRG